MTTTHTGRELQYGGTVRLGKTIWPVFGQHNGISVLLDLVLSAEDRVAEERLCTVDGSVKILLTMTALTPEWSKRINSLGGLCLAFAVILTHDISHELPMYLVPAEGEGFFDPDAPASIERCLVYRVPFARFHGLPLDKENVTKLLARALQRLPMDAFLGPRQPDPDLSRRIVLRFRDLWAQQRHFLMALASRSRPLKETLWQQIPPSLAQTISSFLI